MDDKKHDKSVSVDETTEIDTERREALERLGKYAAYTPPMILTLLSPRVGNAQEAGSPGMPPPPPGLGG